MMEVVRVPRTRVRIGTQAVQLQNLGSFYSAPVSSREGHSLFLPSVGGAFVLAGVHRGLNI